MSIPCERERLRRYILQSQQHVTYFNGRLIRFSLWVFLMAVAFIVTACVSLRKTILVPMVFLPLMVPMVFLPIKRSKNSDETA